ncbi:hypothetical protein TcasGA2_TC012944 [Tribolium castaneum]|uniref:Uncharacterized protein n=1 Tax=Tribolium castaneum TaxID=7070 RepID=D6X3F3_TRICA|nr:hypothetical protein TcasGA2_TC012944 [Tribolium castaneum]
MTNTDSKTGIIDAILKNREIIKNRIHLKQFKEHLTKEEIKKLRKPITDKLDNITEFTQQILMSEANPKNVLAIEEQDLPKLKDKNIPKNADEISPEPKANAESDDVSESDNLLSFPKSPTSISLDPNKDLNFDIIEKQFKFEKPSHLLSLDIRSRNAKIDTTIPEISTKLKSLNAHLTNAKKSQEQEKIDNLQYVYSQLKKYKSVLEDIRKIPIYEKQTGSEEIINPILNKMKEKSWNEHLRGDGLKKGKANRLTKKSKDIIKNLLNADEIGPERPQSGLLLRRPKANTDEID